MGFNAAQYSIKHQLIALCYLKVKHSLFLLFHFTIFLFNRLEEEGENDLINKSNAKSTIGRSVSKKCTFKGLTGIKIDDCGEKRLN